MRLEELLDKKSMDLYRDDCLGWLKLVEKVTKKIIKIIRKRTSK